MGIMMLGFGGLCSKEGGNKDTTSGSSEPTPPSPVTISNPVDGTTNVSISESLSWGSAAGATSYDVYFSVNIPPITLVFKTNTSGINYNPGPLDYNTTYWWRIDSVNSAGSTTGNVWSFQTETAPTTPPSAPSGVYASAGNQQVTVSWNNVSGATSYNIYWSTVSGVTKATGTKISGVTGPYVHTGRTNGTTYYYVVTAVNSYGESSESSQVSATPDTIPSAPSGVSATAGNTQVTINWNNVSGATSYNVYWSTTSGVTKATGTKISGVTSPYVHTGRTNGTTYYYVVTAVNSYGESSESSQVSAIPTAGGGTAVDDYVWVTNQESDNVTRIKKSDLTKTTIAVGDWPMGVAVDETYCWVTNWGSGSGNTVTRIKKSDLSTTTITVGTGPLGIAVDETYCWVANQLSGNVTRLKKSDLSTTTITVGTAPTGVAIDVTYVWVANASSANVTRIKKSDSSKTTISVGPDPIGVAADATYVWVANSDTDNVTRIKKSDLSTTTITVGTWPYGVAVDSNYIWVTNMGSDTVTRILKSDSSTTTINVGTSPIGVAVDATYCWVANSNPDYVTRILKSDSSKTTISVGPAPFALGDMTGYAYDNIPQ
jgi:YVTN family beta-propeller protein